MRVTLIASKMHYLREAHSLFIRKPAEFRGMHTRTITEFTEKLAESLQLHDLENFENEILLSFLW